MNLTSRQCWWSSDLDCWSMKGSNDIPHLEMENARCAIGKLQKNTVGGSRIYERGWVIPADYKQSSRTPILMSRDRFFFITTIIQSPLIVNKAGKDFFHSCFDPSRCPYTPTFGCLGSHMWRKGSWGEVMRFSTLSIEASATVLLHLLRIWVDHSVIHSNHASCAFGPPFASNGMENGPPRR